MWTGSEELLGNLVGVTWKFMLCNQVDKNCYEFELEK